MNADSGMGKVVVKIELTNLFDLALQKRKASKVKPRHLDALLHRRSHGALIVRAKICPGAFRRQTRSIAGMGRTLGE